MITQQTRKRSCDSAVGVIAAAIVDIPHDELSTIEFDGFHGVQYVNEQSKNLERGGGRPHTNECSLLYLCTSPCIFPRSSLTDVHT